MSYKGDYYEYNFFGPIGEEKIVRRPVDSADDWEECPEDGLMDAKITIEVGKIMRANPLRSGARIIRTTETPSSELGEI